MGCGNSDDRDGNYEQRFSPLLGEEDVGHDEKTNSPDVGDPARATISGLGPGFYSVTAPLADRAGNTVDARAVFEIRSRPYLRVLADSPEWNLEQRANPSAPSGYAAHISGVVRIAATAVPGVQILARSIQVLARDGRGNVVAMQRLAAGSTNDGENVSLTQRNDGVWIDFDLPILANASPVSGEIRAEAHGGGDTYDISEPFELRSSPQAVPLADVYDNSIQLEGGGAINGGGGQGCGWRVDYVRYPPQSQIEHRTNGSGYTADYRAFATATTARSDGRLGMDAAGYPPQGLVYAASAASGGELNVYLFPADCCNPQCTIQHTGRVSGRATASVGVGTAAVAVVDAATVNFPCRSLTGIASCNVQNTSGTPVSFPVPNVGSFPIIIPGPSPVPCIQPPVNASASCQIQSCQSMSTQDTVAFIGLWGKVADDWLSHSQRYASATGEGNMMLGYSVSPQVTSQSCPSGEPPPGPVRGNGGTIFVGTNPLRPTQREPRVCEPGVGEGEDCRSCIEDYCVNMECSTSR